MTGNRGTAANLRTRLFALIAREDNVKASDVNSPKLDELKVQIDEDFKQLGNDALVEFVEVLYDIRDHAEATSAMLARLLDIASRPLEIVHRMAVNIEDPRMQRGVSPPVWPKAPEEWVKSMKEAVQKDYPFLPEDIKQVGLVLKETLGLERAREVVELSGYPKLGLLMAAPGAWPGFIQSAIAALSAALKARSDVTSDGPLQVDL
jgi:hypothetical protein